MAKTSVRQIRRQMNSLVGHTRFLERLRDVQFGRVTISWIQTLAVECRIGANAYKALEELKYVVNDTRVGVVTANKLCRRFSFEDVTKFRDTHHRLQKQMNKCTK